MRVKEQGGTIIREFDSIRELVKYFKESKVSSIFRDSQTALSNSYSFTQTNSMDHALQLLEGGWDEGSKRLTSSLNIANAKMQSKEVKRAIYDIVGFQASVPRYLQGIPTSMVNKKNVKQKQKTITLVKSIAYAARVKTYEILNDSVKFLQIVQEIEKRGVRANVYVAFHAIESSEQVFYKVKIKSASERLNISKMSFPLMHPSFLRRIIFRALEVEDRIKLGSWAFGKGRPAGKHETARLIKKDERLIPTLISEHEAIRVVEESIKIDKA